MGFWKSFADFIMMPDVSGIEKKQYGNYVSKTVGQISADQMEQDHQKW